MASIAVVYHSGSGRTKLVAEHVHKGMQSVGDIQADLFTVDDAIEDMGRLDSYDAIVFGCPTYMGSVSADFKRFMDASSRAWMEQRWKDKIAAGFTNSGGLSGDKLNTLNSLVVFAGQHSMIWVSQGIMVGEKNENGEALNRISGWTGLMTQTDPQAPSPPKADLDTAERFGNRVAEATVRWTNGA